MLINAETVADPDGNIRAYLRSYGSVERYITSVQDYLPAALQPQDNQANQQGQPSDSVVQQAHAAILQQLQQRIPKLVSGTELFSAIDATRLLPFGVDGIDNLLLGGMRETTVTELSGETCSGKTQLCHLAAITTAQRGERVVYIDTTNAFSAARASQLLTNYTGDVMAHPAHIAVLNNITLVRCHAIHALLSCLDELAAQANNTDPNTWPKLVVVDSISALLASVIGGLQHNQGRVLVAETGRLLRHVADSLKLAVLVTNHVVGAGSSSRTAGQARDDAAGASSSSSTGGGRLGPGDVNFNYKPALGEQWRGLPHVRVQLSRVPIEDLVCATLLTHSLQQPGHQGWVHIGDTIQDAQRPG